MAAFPYQDAPHCLWFFIALFISALLVVIPVVAASPSYRFTDNFYVGWRPDHVWLEDNAHIINLKMDNTTGSGFQSMHSYLRGYVSMKIRLVYGNSAGVVVAYYMTSPRPPVNATVQIWDEIDFEFLGNVTGQPWILQTNIFTNGTGGREQRILLWFDPTVEFHTYSILWNTHQIVWYVDSVPIRLYRNTNVTAATYPSQRPMTVYSSLWDGDNWATRGGLDKINWTYSPFIASYSKFLIDACQSQVPEPSCTHNTTGYWWDASKVWTLNPVERKRYTWVHHRFVVYDYCTDFVRYPIQMPECSVPPW